MKKHKFLWKSFLLLFVSCLVLTGCSKDDDKGDKFGNDGPPEVILLDTEIELPMALQASPYPYAQELVAQVNVIKMYEIYSYFAMVPPGATVSHTPIQADGQFTRNTDADSGYTVYTYSYGGATIAYQFSEQGNMYVIEIFYDGPETTGFVPYMEIRQNFEGTEGTMKIFGFAYDDDFSMLEWTWQVNSDDSMNITMNGYGSGIFFEMTYYPDMSGDFYSYINGSLDMEFHWNPNGSGNWIDHSTGESGSW